MTPLTKRMRHNEDYKNYFILIDIVLDLQTRFIFYSVVIDKTKSLSS